MGNETSKLTKKTGWKSETINKLRECHSQLLKQTDLSTEDLLVNFEVDQDLSEILFRALDQNGNGQVEFTEFVTAMYLMGPAKLDEKIDFFFQLFDVKGNGSICPKQFSDITLHSAYTMDSLKQSLNNLLIIDDDLTATTIDNTTTNTTTSTTTTAHTATTATTTTTTATTATTATAATTTITTTNDNTTPTSARSKSTIKSGSATAVAALSDSESNRSKKEILGSFMNIAATMSTTLHREPSIFDVQQRIINDFLANARVDEKGNITAEQFKEYAKQHPELLMSLMHMRKSMLDLIRKQNQPTPTSSVKSIFFK
eukprot:TRINITY_DN1145_c0_g1_i1.p1 TRINITY_DN1145_c0_g1~~TRINITY_DN1145_c0_g1_i1.p1  ORF type:complete len:315 (+),score=136.16 TRINITY_DN1145_c0_g1_i1:115-1059(+)